MNKETKEELQEVFYFDNDYHYHNEDELEEPTGNFGSHLIRGFAVLVGLVILFLLMTRSH